MNSTKEEPKPRPRPRVRLLNALDLLGRAGGIEIDEAVRGRLFELSEDEFGALLDRIVSELRPMLDAVAQRPVPPVDQQIEDFKRWQQSRGTFFQWPEQATAALRAKLAELGAGVELVPLYAMTVGIKLPDGRLIMVDRNGRQTKV